MASIPSVFTRLLTRNKLATVFQDHETLKAFENLQKDVAETLPDAIGGMSTDVDSLLAAKSFLPHAVTPNTPNDDAARLLAAASFLHREPPLKAPADESERMIAAQIFGG